MKIMTIVLPFLLIIGCATTGPDGKRSFIVIPSSVEQDIGKQVAADVEKEEKVLSNAEVQSYVNQLGQKIARVSDRKKLKYRFKVIDKNEINAFACPGGYIYVYSGLMKIMGNEAQLAAVLAHEVGHVVARHSVKRLQAVYGYSLLMEIALGDKMGKLAREAVDASVGLILQGYGRSNEIESDNMGVLYTKKASLNPNGMVQVFEKFKSMEGKPPSTLEKLLSTHPPTQDRINNAKKQIGKIGGSDFTYNEDEYKRILSLLQ